MLLLFSEFLVNKERHPLTGTLICSYNLSKLKLLLDFHGGNVKEQSEEVSIGGTRSDSIGTLPSHLEVTRRCLHLIVVADQVELHDLAVILT